MGYAATAIPLNANGRKRGRPRKWCACDILARRHLRTWLHAKDVRLTRAAEAAGWTVLRFWEHEIYKQFDWAISKIAETRQNLLKTA